MRRSLTVCTAPCTNPTLHAPMLVPSSPPLHPSSPQDDRKLLSPSKDVLGVQGVKLIEPLLEIIEMVWGGGRQCVGGQWDGRGIG